MSDNTPFTCKVCKVIDNYTLVLNCGSADNIEKGFSFLIYEIGDDIFDPDNPDVSLGQLEVVKGTGIVTHIQEKICTITSNEYKTINTAILNNPISKAFLGYSDEYINNDKKLVPFKNPQLGDLAKYVP